MKLNDNNVSTINSSYIESIISLCPEIENGNFEYTSCNSNGDILNISFREKSNLSKEIIPKNVKPKGFFPEITIEEIQVDNQKVYITIKRKRWVDINTNNEGFINWTLLKFDSIRKDDYDLIFRNCLTII